MNAMNAIDIGARPLVVTYAENNRLALMFKLKGAA